jgi:hypothetical protein
MFASDTLELKKDATATPPVTGQDAGQMAYGNYTWTTSDQSVATVSTSGQITARNDGTAVITATAKDSSLKMESISVYVSETGEQQQQQQQQATIIVKHIDTEDSSVLDTDTYTVPAGEYGPYSVNSYLGYDAGALATGSAPASGTIAGGETKTITYNYTKSRVPDAFIYIMHKDSVTGAVLKQGVYTVVPGAYGPFNASSIKGYGAGVLAADSAPASGTIDPGEIKTITYVYTNSTQQATATINVVHKDSATGATLKQDSFTVPAGAYGLYSAGSFESYGSGVLADGSAPTSGTIAAGETKTITY